MGLRGVVVPPSLTPVESGTKFKTDKRDSRKLAKLLEGNMLRRAYVLSREDRADRELLRTRRFLIGTVHYFLLPEQGIPIPLACNPLYAP
jgi:transposase